METPEIRRTLDPGFQSSAITALREFLKLSGVAAIALPGPALAQKDLPLVAVLFPGTAKLANDRIAAIRKGLQEAGLAEGVNYAFALRFADGVFDRLPGLALELAALKPRVIVASVRRQTPRSVPDSSSLRTVRW